MNYSRADVVLVPFPFVTAAGVRQKARPALVVSDHSRKRRYDDLILVAISSRKPTTPLATEYIIESNTEDFKKTGLKKTSVVRCEYLMALPQHLIARKIGRLPPKMMEEVAAALRLSLGL